MTSVSKIPASGTVFIPVNPVRNPFAMPRLKMQGMQQHDAFFSGDSLRANTKRFLSSPQFQGLSVQFSSTGKVGFPFQRHQQFLLAKKTPVEQSAVPTPRSVRFTAYNQTQAQLTAQTQEIRNTLTRFKAQPVSGHNPFAAGHKPFGSFERFSNTRLIHHLDIQQFAGKPVAANLEPLIANAVQQAGLSPANKNYIVTPAHGQMRAFADLPQGYHALSHPIKSWFANQINHLLSLFGMPVNPQPIHIRSWRDMHGHPVTVQSVIAHEGRWLSVDDFKKQAFTGNQKAFLTHFGKLLSFQEATGAQRGPIMLAT